MLGTDGAGAKGETFPERTHLWVRAEDGFVILQIISAGETIRVELSDEAAAKLEHLIGEARRELRG